MAKRGAPAWRALSFLKLVPLTWADAGCAYKSYNAAEQGARRVGTRCRFS